RTILCYFPLHLMETLRCCLSLHGYTVVFTVLAMISKGSPCEAPSSPECFRRGADHNMYKCEWSMNTTESDVTFDFYLNETKIESIKNNTSAEFTVERLIIMETVYIWLEAHDGNSSCTSLKSFVVLASIVKYEAPQEIMMSWVKDNLNLRWKAAENYPALAEVRFRRHGHPNESWVNTLNSTKTKAGTSVYPVRLLSNSAYQVQIRQKSTQARKPLWSDWSPVVDVPAELKEKPDVNMSSALVNGTRTVTLFWKRMPSATAVTGVTYSLNNTQYPRGCPCLKSTHLIQNNKKTFHFSYSAVDVFVIANNTAGYSPPAVVHLPAVTAADLKACSATLLDEKLDRKTCLEWYELHNGDPRPENVITLTGRQKTKDRQRIKKVYVTDLKDFVRYLYYEHRCDDGKPRTVEMCLFYKKEDAPLTEPQDFNANGETHCSVNLSWRGIPSEEQRGFLTHYSLCREKMSSQDESPECHNISASLITYHLENLTPATKYTISLAGVTRGGEGPNAVVTINTLPEKTFNVWWSLGLLLLFFLFPTMCAFILKRIKTKICPPVPTPVIDFNSYPTKNQEMQVRKEEVHDLTLHVLLPEDKTVPEETEGMTGVRGEWDGTDEDMENERGDSRMSGDISDEGPDCTDDALRSSRETEMTDLQQLENKFAMLIYRNGLVFDVKTDSP
ncbi:interleukin-12 receptor subunit beta-2, partial [Labrus mixtus]|uniref:interleukin-12 receptor subunit beta-2 n=1 Tax=Labrus mixtus TaxID=508554 RepID=UPI0029C0525D